MMKPEKSLRGRALDLLSRREYSRAELRQKLLPYAEENIDELDELLDELAARNWQSDARFAEAFVHSKSSKHGRFRLQQALAAKGIDREMAAEFMPDEQDELLHAREVLQKKFKQPAQTPQEKQKQIRFLLYRGFAMDTVMKVLRLDWDE